MADVRVSYESVNNAANKIAAAEEELGRLIANLDSVVQVMGNDNEGKAYRTFTELWNETKPQLEKLKECVGENAPRLRQFAARIQDADVW